MWCSVPDRSVLTCPSNCHRQPASCQSVTSPHCGMQPADVVGGPSSTEAAGHCWYHGALPRTDAEALVRRDGEYLVRDSSTQAGHYVLTLRWAGVPLHFVVNQRPSSDVGQPSRLLYHFEEDAFGSVRELLDWYVRQRKPITETSGAIASVPVIRAPTISYSEPVATPPRRASPERPLSVPTAPRFTAVDIPVDAALPSPIRGHQRVGSEPVLSPQPLSNADSGTFDLLDVDAKSNLTGSDSDLTRPPPPKPTRLPTIRIGRDEKKPVVHIRNHALYDDDGKDYSDYSQVRRSPLSCRYFRSVSHSPHTTDGAGFGLENIYGFTTTETVMIGCVIALLVF